MDEAAKEQKFIDWTVLYRQDEIACYEMDVKACAGCCDGIGRKHLIQFFLFCCAFRFLEERHVSRTALLGNRFFMKGVCVALGGISDLHYEVCLYS